MSADKTDLETAIATVEARGQTASVVGYLAMMDGEETIQLECRPSPSFNHRQLIDLVLRALPIDTPVRVLKVNDDGTLSALVPRVVG